MTTVDRATKVLTQPRSQPADSFVLHAPLELLTRRLLLPLIRQEAKPEAEARIAEIAEQFEAFGPAFGPAFNPAPVQPHDSLGDAIDSGDLDLVDATVREFCVTADAATFIRSTANCIVDRLGGAAHGSIYAHLLRQLEEVFMDDRLLLRGLAREIARNPEAEIKWIAERTATAPTNDLEQVLLNPPRVGPLESNFIIPTMKSVDTEAMAGTLLDSSTIGLSPVEAGRILLKIAAWSMLQDDPIHAPYGWSHCFTMPHATLAIADLLDDPSVGIAVAATYVLGFRATLSSKPLDPSWEPPAGHPSAHIWSASDDEYPVIVTDVLTAAAIHPDAHLAKYCLSCHQAAEADPAAGRLFMAAAASLVDWWKRADENTD
jgi:hypothetical protein